MQAELATSGFVSQLKSAKLFGKSDSLSDTDAYAQVHSLSRDDSYECDRVRAQLTWGSKTFRTDEVKNTQSPVWNAEVSFWIDAKRHKTYVLEVGVFDKVRIREQTRA